MKQKILEVLENIKEPVEIIEINDMLKLTTPKELSEVINAVDELVDEFYIQATKKNKYRLMKYCNEYKAGRISINKKGDGFLILDGDDLFIKSKNLNGAIHGDRVLCELFTFNGKIEGKVIKIAKRKNDNMVRVVYTESKDKYIKPIDNRINLKIKLSKDTSKECVDGHIVSTKIVKEINKANYLADVNYIVSHITDPKSDILTIAALNGRIVKFPDEVMEYLETIEDEVQEKDKKGRTDLTNLNIFTIDGDDTKDIDDAVSIKKLENGNYELGVHIADVSHYVKEDSPLDKEALARGTSTYIADTVIPMLPRKLSNGICSLNEGEIRCTISCVMEINDKGKVVNSNIFPSYIKSRKKMTYKKVNDILVRNIIDKDYEPFVNDLKELEKLSKILRKMKHERGEIDFEIDELKVIQDENGKAIDIQKRTREVGEMLIEDMMIAANETVATTLNNYGYLPALYRVHGEPDPKKIEQFMNLVKQLGVNLDSKLNSFKPKQIQKIIEKLKNEKYFKILSQLLLRSMRKAEYKEYNIGHFGLASKCYTHFTSPIRRYPDLETHRLIRTYIFENKIDNNTIEKYKELLPNIAKESSDREVDSVSAERDGEDMKVAEYMEDHIGEEYKGMICSIANYGMYVQLENMVEGLVRIGTLKGDFYNYVPELLSLIGEATKKTYRLGDEVIVKVVGASKEAKTVDFELVENEETNKIKSDKNGN